MTDVDLAPIVATSPTSAGVKKERNKTDMVIKLLGRAKGASIAEISTATGWQAHTIRAFFSRVVRKKLGRDLVREKDGKGETRYRFASGPEA